MGLVVSSLEPDIKEDVKRAHARRKAGLPAANANTQGAQTNAGKAASKKHAQPKKKVCFIDVDNMFFRGGEPDEKCFEQRWESMARYVKNAADEVVASCNRKTMQQLGPYFETLKAATQIDVVSVIPDAADHRLLQEFVRRKDGIKEATVISRDRTLSKLFFYFALGEKGEDDATNVKLVFKNFGENDCVDLVTESHDKIRLNFDSRENIDKFIDSLGRFNMTMKDKAAT